ncbi:MAG: ribbon-helix-helix domain-containing protein [Lentisphaeraceae bacterium]|nr:ribbon-helix-helix domain-containing protein [Lentisphaeraceae bacterium]
MKAKKITTSIQLESETLHKIDNLALKLERSRSWVINKLLKKSSISIPKTE